MTSPAEQIADGLSRLISDAVTVALRSQSRPAASTAAADDAVRLYSVAVLAKLWDCSEGYIRDEIRAGRLPAVRLANGDRKKARVSAIDAAKWIAARRLGEVT